MYYAYMYIWNDVMYVHMYVYSYVGRQGDMHKHVCMHRTEFSYCNINYSISEIASQYIQNFQISRSPELPYFWKFWISGNIELWKSRISESIEFQIAWISLCMHVCMPMYMCNIGMF